MEQKFIKILGINFFNGSLLDSIKIAQQGGLVVAPSGPGMASDLIASSDYKEALTNADLVIPDSGLMCLWQKLVARKKLERISGYSFLKSYLNEFMFFDSSFWVMPNEKQDSTNRSWLNKNHGVKILNDRIYIAPIYKKNAPIEDIILLTKLKKCRPRTIFIQLGGGVQECLGFYLKKNLDYQPTILCTGAALAFLSGEQVRIPRWVDRYYFGWFFRCVSNPCLFLPRYFKAIRLIFLLSKFGKNSPK